VADLDKLLDAAPALRPQVAEAEWVGHRRWNLTFKTGQTLELPEGAGAATALTTFARLDGTHQLIGGQVLAFDMRAGDRMYMRRAPGAVDDAAPIATASPAPQASPAPSPTDKAPEHTAEEHKAPSPKATTAHPRAKEKP